MDKIIVLIHKLGRFWLFFLVFESQILLGQQTPLIEVGGKVVEMVNGKYRGVPNVGIGINRVDHTQTGQDGSFHLRYPNASNQKYIKLVLDDSVNRQMLSPTRGIVYFPPPNDIEVWSSSKQNLALISKIGELNTKVKSLQDKYNLSENGVQKLQNEMKETVKLFEQKVQTAQVDYEQLNVKSNLELEGKDRRIKELEKELNTIQQQIIETKDDYFSKKQAVFKSISSVLRHYLDAVQNLRDMLLPDRVSHYFINPEGMKQLSRKIDAYNDARDTLLFVSQDASINAVQHYWTTPSVKLQLEATYTYILSDVHDKVVYPVEFTVMETIKKWTTGKLGRQEAQKKATQASKEPFSRLTVMIPILEEKIISTINELKLDF